MRWKDPAERHSDELIAAIADAARGINHTLAEGFKLVATTIHAAGSGGVDNSPAIELAVKKIRQLTDSLTKSLPPK